MYVLSKVLTLDPVGNYKEHIREDF